MSKNEPEETADVAAAEEAATARVPPAPDGVIDPELYRLTMAVVYDMDTMVTQYLARDGYKYVPNRTTRKVTAFDSGWPNVSLKEQDESRVAHAELFAHKVSSIDPFAYDDIPSMAALKEYVHGNEEVAERLRQQNPEGRFPADLAASMMDTTINMFPEASTTGPWLSVGR